MGKRGAAAPPRPRRVRRKDQSQFLRTPPPLACGLTSIGNMIAVHGDAPSSGGIATGSNRGTRTSQDVVHGDIGRSDDHPPPNAVVEEPLPDDTETPVMYMDDESGVDRFISSGGDGACDVLDPVGDFDVAIDSDDRRALKSSDAFRMLTEGGTLAAVFAVLGTKRFSVWQYDVMRRHVNGGDDCNATNTFPSYSKIQQAVLPLLREHFFVPATTERMRVDVRKSGAPRAVLGPDGSMQDPIRDIRVVPISAWGKRDVSELRVEAVSHAHGSGEGGARALGDGTLFSCIDDAIVTTRRDSVLTSALMFTTEEHSGYDIPCWTFADSAGGVHVDIWVCGGDELGPLRRYFSDPDMRRHSSGNRRLWVVRSALYSRIWLVREHTDLFEPGDVVAEVRPQGLHSNLPGRSGPDIQMFLVWKITRKEGISAFHLLVVDGGAAVRRTWRVRCMRVIESSSAEVSQQREGDAQGPFRNPCTVANSETGTAATTGKLSDGRNYMVYRVAIFADGFDPFVGKKGSAGGCYLLPVGIPLSERAGVKGIHVLSLTPPGVSTGQVITALIQDVIEGTVNGYKNVKTRDGVELQVFIDVVGYLCDYYAVQEESDLRGHTSLAPCNACTFKKGDRGGGKNSCFAYTTSTHSGNGAFRRDEARMDMLRKICTTEDQLKSVGLRKLPSAAIKNLPLHSLSRALREARSRVPLTAEGKPVVTASFDPYLSIMVAPDHLFTNLIKDVVTTNIKCLSVKKRSCAHVLIRNALEGHGLRPEAQYIDVSNARLHVMSMTALYKLIMVAPWAFAMAHSMDNSGVLHVEAYDAQEVVTLSFMLQKLIADTLFYAKRERDGSVLATQFTPRGWKERERSLKVKAMQYITALDRCCGNSEVCAKELDKPNVHRLLELYVHTIPTFGHVRQYQELSLERTHQPLKRALNHSNFRGAQLQAMDHMLADDWKGRIKAATKGVRKPAELSSSMIEDLKRMLTATGSGENERLERARTEEVRRVFNSSFLRDISDFQSVQPSHGAAACSHENWVGADAQVLHGPAYDTLWSELVDCGKRALEAHLKNTNGNEFVRVTHRRRVFLLRETLGVSKLPRRDSFQDNIQCHDVIQAIGCLPRTDVVEGNGRVVSTLLTTDAGTHYSSWSAQAARAVSRVKFWYIIDLLQVSPSLDVSGKRCEIVAVVLPVVGRDPEGAEHTEGVTDRGLPQTYCLGESVIDGSRTAGYLLPLHCGVMKPMLLHVCRGSCTFDVLTAKLHHSTGWGDNGEWVVAGSVEGFPPKSG